MRAYSQDIRQRILMAVDAGRQKSEIARTFSIDRATIYRYMALRDKTGKVEPGRSPGRPADIPRKDYAALVVQLNAAPDATLAEYCDKWRQASGVSTTITTMHRTIGRVGWTRKKRLLQLASKTR